MFKRIKDSQGNYDIIIRSSIAADKKIQMSGSVRIDGCIKGILDIDGDLYLNEKAIIDGNVSAKKAVIAGIVNGNLRISSNLVLCPTAVINGSLSVNCDNKLENNKYSLQAATA